MAGIGHGILVGYDAGTGGRLRSISRVRSWVGIDGATASDAALAFADEEAILRGVPLVAVCALSDAAGTVGAGHHIEEDFDRP